MTSDNQERRREIRRASDSHQVLSESDIRWLMAEFDSLRQALSNHHHPAYAHELDALKKQVWIAIGGFSVFLLLINYATSWLTQ